MEHFILGCRCLETVRNPVLHELVTKLKECDIDFWQSCKQFEFHRESGDVFTRMAVDLKQWMDLSLF
jgi:hypothetical protein